MKRLILLTALLAGCFDSAMPFDPQCVAPVEAANIECDVALDEAIDGEDEANEELEKAFQENEALRAENAELKEVIKVKNYTIGNAGVTVCGEWLVEAQAVGDLVLLETECAQ